MIELLPKGGSEGYGAGSDEAAAPLWNSWKARNCRASRACWTRDEGETGIYHPQEVIQGIFLQKM